MTEERDASHEKNVDDYVPDFDVPKRRIWPFFVGLLLIAGGIGLFWYRNATKPMPLRVLIAVDLDGYWWDDSKPAATLADELGDFLSDKGFEVVSAGQPDVEKVLSKAKSPLDAARELRAAFVIRATIDPAVEKLPIQGGYYEVWLESSLEIVHTADEEPFFRTPIQTSAGALGRKRALELLAELTSKVARAEVVPALMKHASVRQISTGHDPVLIDQLAPAKAFVKARQALIDQAMAEYQEVADARKAEERGLSGLTFHSDMRAEDQLVGVGNKGVLRVSAPVELYYDPTRSEILRRERLETLEWFVDDGEPEVIWRGYNAFTYPSASRDGSTAVLVEDLYGWARSLAVIRGDKLKRIRVEHERALSQPRISPDMRMVALVDRQCRRCDEEIAVLSLADAKEIYRIGPEQYHRIGGFKWMGDEHLVVVAQPPLPPEPDPDAETDEPAPEPRPFGLYRVSLTGEWELLIDAGFRKYVDPVMSPDQSWLAVSDYRDQVLVYDVSLRTHRVVAVGGRASALSFSGDSKHLVFEIDGLPGSGEAEIAMLSVAQGDATRLTQNPWPDRYPLFSHDGKRIYFEARNPDPAFRGLRTVSRIASVPVP